MHVRETAQIVESIPFQHLAAVQASAIADGAPVHVGPVTLRPRFNAVATSPAPSGHADLSEGYGAEEVPGSTDPRQSSAELASWVIASAAALSSADGVRSVSYFEEWGPRGLVSAAGDIHPAGRAFAEVRALSGFPLLVQGAIRPGQTAYALGAYTEGGPVVLLANLAASNQTVHVSLADHKATIALEGFEFRRIVL